MEKVAVTVIMPSLNVASYIKESVESVLNQTLRNIEILCIDAGSNDGTLEILQRMAVKDSRVHLVNSERKSYGYQVNLGIQRARGEYLAIVETDDYIDAEMYERLYQTAKKYSSDFVKSDYYAYRTQLDGSRFFVKRTLHRGNELYNRVFNPTEEGNAAFDDWFLWNGIYRTEFIKGNQILLNETAGAAFQDIGFLHKTNVAAKHIIYLHDCFYRYCIDREGSSSNSGKGLCYSFGEFEHLLSESASMSKSQEVALYTRMAKSFYCCIKAIKDLTILDNPNYMEKYVWFQKHINDAIKKGLVVKKSFPDGMWNELQNLLNSVESIKTNREREVSFLTKHLKGKQVAIFGCGNYGMEAFALLTENQISVEYFMDNNDSLWGKRVNGREIRNPNDVVILKEEFFLIANENYWKEMKEQLLKLGCDESKILIYKQ